MTMMGMRPGLPWVDAREEPREWVAKRHGQAYPRMEVLVVEEMRRRERELHRVRYTALQRLARWAKKRLRRDEVPLAAGPAVWPRGIGPQPEVDRDVRDLDRATLAAMPAMRAGPRPLLAVASPEVVPAFAGD
jgi:hypothetical protein